MPCIGCGNVYTKKEDANFIVEKFLCIVNIIIPFFNKYTILGIKASDLKDFKKVAELIGSGAHLKPEGLEQINKIKSDMNTLRKYSD